MTEINRGIQRAIWEVLEHKHEPSPEAVAALHAIILDFRGAFMDLNAETSVREAIPPGMTPEEFGYALGHQALGGPEIEGFEFEVPFLDVPEE